MSALEAALRSALEASDLRGWVAQYRLPESERRFSWDFAFPASRLLIDVQGAVFVKGAHSTGAGIARDAAKLNEATLCGYRVLLLLSRDCKAAALPDTLDTIRAALIAPVLAPRTVEGR